METQNNRDGHSDLALQAVLMLGQRLTALEEKIADIHQVILSQRVQKDWYTTAETAKALGKTDYTIRERWCNEGRIACEKNPESGKWRIPGHEFKRLVSGGALKPKPR